MMKRTRRQKVINVLEAFSRQDADATSLRLREAVDRLETVEIIAAERGAAFRAALGDARERLLPGSVLNLGLLTVAGTNIGVQAQMLQLANRDLDSSFGEVDTVRAELRQLQLRLERYTLLANEEQSRVATERGKTQDKEIDELWTSLASGGH